jgi:hypothetical protein
MGDEGVRELLDSGALARLSWLDLRHGCVTDEGARLLAECPAGAPAGAPRPVAQRRPHSRAGRTEKGGRPRPRR